MSKRISLLSCVVMFLAIMTSFVHAEDPDYSNNAAGAQLIATDGSNIMGSLTSGDEDWFKITGSAHKLYSVSLKGEYGKGYKYLSVYQVDEFGTLHQTLNLSVWSNETRIRTFYIERDYDVYIKAYYDQGQYEFDVLEVGEILPDSYANDCELPTLMSVDTGPIDGVLAHYEDGTLEKDWFIFNTEAMHKYEVRMTRSDNTYVNISLYDTSCGQVVPSANNITVVSWFGEQYKVCVNGNSSYLGSYYTLEVIDLGLMPDEYASTYTGAAIIPVDGTQISGSIDYLASYHSDEDWFRFTPVVNTLYRITLKGELGKDYKGVYAYQSDGFNTLSATLNFSSWSNETRVRTFFIEQPHDVYLKMYYDGGDYEFMIEQLGSYQPDGLVDDCATPQNIVVGAGPVEGILTHSTTNSLESDWYQFNTQPQHKYEIRLTRSDNASVNFSVYNDNCQQVLSNSTNNTVTSWFGESYRLMVNSSASYLGLYYTLEVIDLGSIADDYPNTYAQAVAIAKDGTPIEGEVHFVSGYHSDEDWFKFTAAMAGTYNFSLTGEYGKGYKSLKVYWQDGAGILREKKNVSVWSDPTSNFTVDLPAGMIFVSLYYDLGKYTFSVVSPDPRCGDLEHPYPLGDVNKDCHVDLLDMALLASNWLSCSAPDCAGQTVN